MDKEKRSAERNPGFASIETIDGDAFGFLMDISEAGVKAGFPWEGKLKVGREYAFKVSLDALPGFDRIDFRGKVAWIKEEEGVGTTGIELVKHADEHSRVGYLKLLEFNRKRNRLGG